MKRLLLEQIVLGAALTCLGCSTHLAVDVLEVRLGGPTDNLCTNLGCELEIEVRNTSKSGLRLSETTAIEDFYVFLEIEDRETGDRVAYPLPEVMYLKGPRSRCVAPGESLDLLIDLAHWQPLWEGEVEDSELYAFPISGGEYRVRAGYRAFRTERGRPGCHVPRGVVYSKWLDLVYR